MPVEAIQLIYHVQTQGLRFTNVLCVGDGGPTFKILKDNAAKNGFHIQFVPDPNGIRAEAILQAISPDVLQIQGGKLISKNILAIPKVGTLNTHGGILPDYPGLDSLHWAVLEDGPMGVTVHFATKEVDRGPIVHRRFLLAQPGDSLATLLHRNHHENKWQATAEAMLLLSSGRYKPDKQMASEYSRRWKMGPDLISKIRLKLAMVSWEPVGGSL